MTYLSAQNVADRLGLSLRTVQHHARKYGLGRKIGQRTYLFNEDDVLALQAISQRKWRGAPVTH